MVAFLSTVIILVYDVKRKFRHVLSLVKNWISFFFFSKFIQILKINTFTNTYETLPWDAKWTENPQQDTITWLKIYIFTRWDLLGLAPLDETDVFF